MFERFSEDAKRALFFARYEVTQIGGLSITPEHIVLGVLRGSPDAILRFAREGETAGSIRARIEPAIAAPDKVITSVEIPFSLDCRDVIERTPIEADDLGNPTIMPEHIVLAVMEKSFGEATRALNDAGVQLDAIRDYLTTSDEARQARREPARSPGRPRISRHWKGVVKPGCADAYLAHLRQETLSAIAEMPGFVTAAILRREIADGTEFQIVTLWGSLDAIKAFAGEDLERAVVPPAAQALMSSFDQRAVHYEIVDF